MVLEHRTGVGSGGVRVDLPARVSRAHDVGGWREPRLLDAVGLALVLGCDGATPLAEVVGSVAATAGADPDDVLALALHLVRDLVDEGLLEPR
jgi:hypothetical protein